MSDSKDKGLHSYYGVSGYNYNSSGAYGHPPAGNSGHPAYVGGGYPPVAYPYPSPSGYPVQPQAACPGHHHSGHGGLGAFIGAVAGYMTSRRHGQAHGGYVAHGGHHASYGYGGHHHGKYKHGKFAKYGGFRKWK